MKLLLDTHVFLWSLVDRSRITARVQQLLDDTSNELFFSTASLWEISIKIGKGNLIVPGGSISAVYEQLDLVGIDVLQISRPHIARVETLPHLHRDPFDRMIVAQALEEDMTILSSDSEVAAYAVPIIWK